MAQFFYTRKEKNKEGETKTYTDSFNLNKVIRSIELEDGKRLVVLDDIHEQAREVPDVDPKTGKFKGTKRQRDTFQSEIYLEPEDNERFKSVQ